MSKTPTDNTFDIDIAPSSTALQAVGPCLVSMLKDLAMATRMSVFNNLHRLIQAQKLLRLHDSSQAFAVGQQAQDQGSRPPGLGLGAMPQAHKVDRDLEVGSRRPRPHLLFEIGVSAFCHSIRAGNI